MTEMHGVESGRREVTHSIFPWLLAAGCILVWGVLWWIGNRNGTSSAETVELTIDPPRADVVQGSSAAPPERELRFRLSNVGKETIRLNSIESTCHCTVTRFPKRRVLSPGDSTELMVLVTLPGTGKTAVEVRLETVSSVARRYTIPVTLQGNEVSIPAVIAMPDQIEVRSYQAGASEQRRFIVATREESVEKQWLEGFDSTDSNTQVTELTALTRKRMRGYIACEYLCTLHARVPADQPRRTAWLQPRVRQTGIEKSRRLFVVVERLPEIQVTPAAVSIDGSMLPVTREITLASLTSKTFTASTVDETENGLSVEFDSANERRVHTARIHITRRPSSLARELRIRTTLPDTPEVVIPIVFNSQ